MVEDSEGFVFIFSSLALEMLERFIHHLHFFAKVNQFFRLPVTLLILFFFVTAKSLLHDSLSRLFSKPSLWESSQLQVYSPFIQLD